MGKLLYTTSFSIINYEKQWDKTTVNFIKNNNTKTTQILKKKQIRVPRSARVSSRFKKIFASRSKIWMFHIWKACWRTSLNVWPRNAAPKAEKGRNVQLQSVKELWLATKKVSIPFNGLNNVKNWIYIVVFKRAAVKYTIGYLYLLHPLEF